MENTIPHDTWHIIEIVIRRYPTTKSEYEEYISNIMASSKQLAAGVNMSDDCTKPQSVTEAKALKMTSQRAERMKKQIEAVELTYNNLKPEEKKVMEKRFWTERGRNIPYTKIKGIAYSERQMKRIVKRIITQVGIYLGEI